MKITKKMEKELIISDYFSLKDIDYSKLKTLSGEEKITKAKTTESAEGVSPQEAYFEITVHGKKEIVTTDKGELFRLLDGKNWALRMCDSYRKDMVSFGYTPEQFMVSWFDDTDEAMKEPIRGFIIKSLRGHGKK